jgi:hypothetical protein
MHLPADQFVWPRYWHYFGHSAQLFKNPYVATHFTHRADYGFVTSAHLTDEATFLPQNGADVLFFFFAHSLFQDDNHGKNSSQL